MSNLRRAAERTAAQYEAVTGRKFSRAGRRRFVAAVLRAMKKVKSADRRFRGFRLSVELPSEVVNGSDVRLPTFPEDETCEPNQ